MQTGKAQGTRPMDMLQYRGLPFINKTWGILNVTGVAEGSAFGIHVDPGKLQIEWDSALSRPLSLGYTGECVYFGTTCENEQRKGWAGHLYNTSST